MNKLGIIGRMDLGGGLCHQSLNLCRMLQPDKVLIIDSTPFNKAEQHPELYEGFNVDKVMGFPTMEQYYQWLEGLTHILAAECFYNEYLINKAMRLDIKTFLQPNAEFYSHAVTPPTKFLMPSHWYLEEYQSLYDNVTYLPPPLFPDDFIKAREANLQRTGGRKFLLPIGKPASKDRAGYQAVIDALPHTKSNFEITVRSQFGLEQKTDDKRVSYDIQNYSGQQELYKDFDAVLHLRRYAGLSLPCNEALMSGLPVIMPLCSPNDKLLPKKWLVDADVTDQLQTRLLLDVYTARPQETAKRIDWLCSLSDEELLKEKLEAYELALSEFSTDVLLPRYKSVLGV